MKGKDAIARGMVQSKFNAIAGLVYSAENGSQMKKVSGNNVGYGNIPGIGYCDYLGNTTPSTTPISTENTVVRIPSNNLAGTYVDRKSLLIKMKWKVAGYESPFNYLYFTSNTNICLRGVNGKIAISGGSGAGNHQIFPTDNDIITDNWRYLLIEWLPVTEYDSTRYNASIRLTAYEEVGGTLTELGTGVYTYLDLKTSKPICEIWTYKTNLYITGYVIWSEDKTSTNPIEARSSIIAKKLIDAYDTEIDLDNRFDETVKLVSTSSGLGTLDDAIEAGEAFFAPMTTSVVTYDMKHPKKVFDYKGEVSPRKRFVTIGFDDFRASDYGWVAPLFAKYGYRATFNYINNAIPTDAQIGYVDDVVFQGHEIGDHTILHLQYIYYSPAFNGQNPASVEGTQTPYPTNDELRVDRGDGKNVFGYTITDAIVLPYVTDVTPTPLVDPAKTWTTLSDADCQVIRETFAVIKDTATIAYLDTLSNAFLGTTGSSAGSLNVDTGKYTGGIFTGCATSANHEIWERICQIQKAYFKYYLGLNQDVTEWSLPGSKLCSLLYESSGLYYYDSAKTQLANDMGKMTSSRLNGKDGNALVRSWGDVLRSYGYQHQHDSMYPSRRDGSLLYKMQRTYIMNAKNSKKDCLPWCTNQRKGIITLTDTYDATYFTGSTDWMKTMWDDTTNDDFRASIISIVNQSASGIVVEGLFDTDNTFSLKVYLEMILKFCRMAGIEVVTKSEAFDICFKHTVENGNLLYNPNFENTVAKIIPTAVNPKATPDGWGGSCTVVDDGSSPNTISKILQVTTGNVYSEHYGLPLGVLTYAFQAKGTGTVSVYYIRNKSMHGSVPDAGDLVDTVSISNSAFEAKSITIPVKDEAVISSSLPLEGLDNKICGIYINISGDGLQITQPSLKLV